MSGLSEIKHLDPDNRWHRWHRLQLPRWRQLALFRALVAGGLTVAAAGITLAVTSKARRR